MANFFLLSLATALFSLGVVAIPSPIDCTDCSNGYCYTVESPTGNGTDAASVCSGLGGQLAQLGAADGSFVFVTGTFLPKRLAELNTSLAFVESWNTDNYGDACLLAVASPVSGGVGTAYGSLTACSESHPAVCQFSLENEFAQCANCTLNCFKDKCFDFFSGPYTQPSATSKCTAEGGKLWNAWGAEEWYYVNTLAASSGVKTAWAEGYNNDTYNGACLMFTRGDNPAGGEGGALTQNDCTFTLPAICEYSNSNKTQKCPSADQNVTSDQLTQISALAEQYPTVNVQLSSGNRAFGGVPVVGSLFALVLATVALL